VPDIVPDINHGPVDFLSRKSHKDQNEKVAMQSLKSSTTVFPASKPGKAGGSGRAWPAVKPQKNNTKVTSQQAAFQFASPISFFSVAR
jgi:hypothetical protein